MKSHPAYETVFEMYQRGDSVELVCMSLEVADKLGAGLKAKRKIVERLYRGFRSGLLGG